VLAKKARASEEALRLTVETIRVVKQNHNAFLFKKTTHNLLLFFQSNKNIKNDFSFQLCLNFLIAHPVSH